MATYRNDDYASAGVGTAGLTLGVIGTALASGVLGNSNGLSGLFGSNNQQSQQVSALMAENSKLYAEKYTDKMALDTRDRIAALNESVIGKIVDLDKKVAAMEATAPIKEQLFDAKIAEVANNCNCCCKAANTAIAGLQATLASITKLVVPIGAVCPQPMPQYNSWTAPTTPTATT